MKKLSALFILFAMVLSLVACGKKKPQGFEIPDVFGLNHTDATNILEGEGFTVTAVESKVDSFSEKLLTPLEEVEKGTVFKIDEYILDGDGDINKDYDIIYDDDEFISDDQSLVIYYAKEDYKAPSEESDDEPAESKSDDTEKPKADNNVDSSKEEANTTKNDDISSEFKSAMDSYENFMNEYVDFMKKYSENPTDLNLLTDYSKYMSKYADCVESFEDWENEDLNAKELAYYIEVQARVSKKLLEVAQ